MKRTLPNSARLLVTLAAFTVLGEVMVRVQRYGWTGLTYAPMRSMTPVLMSRFAIEPAVRSITMAGSEGLLPGVSGLNQGVPFRVNNLGFRGPDTTRVPPERVFRVAVLGGSTTMGWGVAEEDTWPVILERLLNEATIPWEGPAGQRPERVEVINLAVPNTRRCLIRHWNRAMYLQADLVLWKIGRNAIDEGLERWLNRCHAEGRRRHVPAVVFTAESRPIPDALPPHPWFRSLGSLGVEFGPEHYILPYDAHPDGAVHQRYAERLVTALVPLLPRFQQLLQQHAPDHETDWRPPQDPRPWRDPQDGFWKSYLLERWQGKWGDVCANAAAAWADLRSLVRHGTRAEGPAPGPLAPR